MSSIRLRSSRSRFISFTSLGLAALLVTNGCGSPSAELEDDQDGVAEALPPLQSLQAEEIYAGIFFGVGPARTLLPEVYGDSAKGPGALDDKEALRRKLNDTASQLQARGDTEGVALVRRALAQLESSDPGSANLTVPREVVTLYLQQIQKQSPGFFERFNTRVRSGNPAAVDAALQDAARETYAASKALLLSSDEGAGVSAQAEQAITAAVAVVAAAAVALVVVIWSGVVLVEGVWVVTISAAEGVQAANKETLLHDELVARVTQSF